MGKPCSGAAGYAPVGLGWERTADGLSWTHYVMRQCRECKGVNVHVAHWVDAQFAFCPRCLGQAIERIRYGEGYALKCQSCGQITEDDSQ